MTQVANAIPSPGYRLLNVSAAYAHYTVLDPDTVEDPLKDSPDMKFFWDWRISAARQFQVYVGILVRGTKAEPQEAEVRLVGSFFVEGSEPSIGIENFVHTSAPAILMPFLRETIRRLTADGPFGAYYLPLVNVQALMPAYPYAESTGARQLAEVPEALEDVDEPSENGGEAREAKA